MHRVVENMGATELRKKYDLLPLFFWRLAGGAELLLEEDIFQNEASKIFAEFLKSGEVASKSKAATGSPEMAFKSNKKKVLPGFYCHAERD